MYVSSKRTLPLNVPVYVLSNQGLYTTSARLIQCTQLMV